MEKFCQTYYDSNLFHSIVNGEDASQKILDGAFQQLATTYLPFSKIERMLFESEMTAMHLEIFSLTCFLRFADTRHGIQQSIYTRRYLNEKNKLNIWEIMVAYNHIIAKIATMRANGQQMTKKKFFDRIALIGIYHDRISFLSNWASANKIDLKNPKVLSSVDYGCAVIACNRYRADIFLKKIGNQKIAGLFLARLGGEELLGHNPEPSADFFTALAALPYSIYEFADKAIKSVDLKFSK